MLFETSLAHDIPRALEKTIMVEVSGHIQSWISRICGKIAAFAGMFISLLTQCLW